MARDVVRHLVDLVPGVPASPAPASPWRAVRRPTTTRSQPGRPPATPYRRCSTTRRRPTGCWHTRTIGEMPLAAAVAQFYTADVFLHTWDLARAPVRTSVWTPSAARVMLEGMLPMDEALRGSGHYGPRVEVPDGRRRADPAARLHRSRRLRKQTDPDGAPRAQRTRTGQGGPMHFVGLDLAWGERNPTGVAVVDDRGRLRARLAQQTDDDDPGRRWRPTSAAVPGRASTLPSSSRTPTGNRPGEAALNATSRRFDAGAHPSNTGKPEFRDGPRGARLAEALGLDLDPRLHGRASCDRGLPAPGDGRAVPPRPDPEVQEQPGRTLDLLRSELLRADRATSRPSSRRPADARQRHHDGLAGARRRRPRRRAQERAAARRGPGRRRGVRLRRAARRAAARSDSRRTATSRPAPSSPRRCPPTSCRSPSRPRAPRSRPHARRRHPRRTGAGPGAAAVPATPRCSPGSEATTEGYVALVTRAARRRRHQLPDRDRPGQERRVVRGQGPARGRRGAASTPTRCATSPTRSGCA